MAGLLVIPNTFASQTGPIPLSQFDSNFSTIAAAVNTLQTFDNYYVDGGVANTIAVTVPSPQVVAYGAGLMVQVKVAYTNTGATTLNINSLGATPVVLPNGSALPAGALTAGGVYQFQHDGTSFQLTTPNVSVGGFTFLKAKTAATSRTTATMSADPDLTCSLAAGTYQFNAFVQASLPTAVGGIQINFVYGAGGGFNSSLSKFVASTATTTSAASFGAYQSVTITAAPTGAITSSASNTNFYVQVSGVLIATSADMFSLWWGQNTTNASATSVNAGSYLTVTRLA